MEVTSAKKMTSLSNQCATSNMEFTPLQKSSMPPVKACTDADTHTHVHTFLLWLLIIFAAGDETN